MAKSYPPLKFQADGKDTGVEMQMAIHLADFLQVPLEYRVVEVTTSIGMLQSGQIDMIMAALSTDNSRAQKIWFSEPYLEITAAALVEKRALPQTQFGQDFEDKPIQTIWQLKQLPDFTFIVKKGTVYESMLQKEFPGKRIITVASDDEGLKALLDRRGNGYVQDSVFLEYKHIHTGSLQTSFRLLKGGNRKETIAIGLPFGASILKNQVDFWIKEAKRKGLINEWLRKFNRVK